MITCANVANLLLARVSARQKEIALRMSVGGGPLRVLRQLIAESLVLALLGGLGGVVLAGWLLRVVMRVMANAIPRLAESSIDGPVLAFAIAASMLTALLFGLGPAIALCRTNVQEVLKDGVKSASASRRSVRAVRAVVALQLALTVVLLSGAGLMIKSMWRMNTHAPGFDPGQILTLRVDFSGAAYKDPAAKRAYVDRLIAQVGSLPGVQSVAITTGGDSMMLVLKEGQPIPENRAAHAAGLSATTPNFPSLVGMHLVKGEWMSEAEPRGILINESAARRNFADSDPIGQRIQFPWVADRGFAPIVGVVADMKYSKLDAEPGPEVFVNYAGAQMFGITILVRTEGDPLAAAPTIRKVVADLDRTQPVFEVKTMEQALAEYDRAAPVQPAVARNLRGGGIAAGRARHLRRGRLRGRRADARDRHPPRPRRPSPPRGPHGRPAGNDERHRRYRDRARRGRGSDAVHRDVAVWCGADRSTDVRRRHARPRRHRVRRLRGARAKGGVD